MRYDLRPDPNTPSALELVTQKVTRHNQENPNDPVFLIADVVQLGGRLPLPSILEMLEPHPFVAIAHSGSKFPGGVPHAGFLVLTELGRAVLQQSESTLTEQEARHLQVVSGPVELTETSPDLLALIRAIDNIQALSEVEQLHQNDQFHNVVSGLRAEYVALFEAHGFKILPNDTPTIIAMEPPPNLLSNRVDDLFLSSLAKEGITMSGFLKEGARPILRFGISAKLVRMVLENTVSNNQLQNWKNSFQQKLAEAVTHTLVHQHD